MIYQNLFPAQSKPIPGQQGNVPQGFIFIMMTWHSSPSHLHKCKYQLHSHDRQGWKVLLNEGRHKKMWACVHMWFLFPLLWSTLCRDYMFRDLRWQIFKCCIYFPLLIELAKLPTKCLLEHPSFPESKGDVRGLILIGLLLPVEFKCPKQYPGFQTDKCRSFMCTHELVIFTLDTLEGKILWISLHCSLRKSRRR